MSLTAFVTAMEYLMKRQRYVFVVWETFKSPSPDVRFL